MIVTTRSLRKSGVVVAKLIAYLRRNLLSRIRSASRVTISSQELDLCKLRTVLHAANSLLTTIPKLDALICAASITGWSGLDIPNTIWRFLTDPFSALACPEYHTSTPGLTAQPQISLRPSSSTTSFSFTTHDRTPPLMTAEPTLGTVFCTNVFGHYVLAHHLSPILSQAREISNTGRIIFLSNLSPAPSLSSPSPLQLSDIQALHWSADPYLSSQRLLDVLALTSTDPSVSLSLTSFSARLEPQPRMYICHPGVLHCRGITSKSILYLLLALVKLFLLYIARLFVSPWYTIWPYSGAKAPVWLALTDQSELDALEQVQGKGKWGSIKTRFFRTKIRRTRVEDWDLGDLEHTDMRETSKEKNKENRGDKMGQIERERFLALGKRVWETIERSRMEWAKRLKGVQVT